MLNLTLLSLLTTNFQHSPLFITHSNLVASKFRIQQSFSTVFFSHHNSLSVSKSVFSHFLSSPVVINLEFITGLRDKPIQTSREDYNFKSCFFQYIANSPAIIINDGTNDIYNYQISKCSFSFCANTDSRNELFSNGGAIHYSKKNIDAVGKDIIDIQNTFFTHCVAETGSAFYMYNYGSLTITENLIESSAPYRRPGISNNIFITKGQTKTDISAVNNTNSCSLKDSSAIALKCRDNINVRYFTAVECNGENTMSIESVSSSSVKFTNLIFISNVGNLKGVINIKGSFLIESSIFIFNKYNPVNVEYGHIVLSKCWLDTPYYLSGSVSFSECVYEISRPQDVTRSTRIRDIVRFSGSPRFNDEPIDYATQSLKTHGFAANAVGKLAIVGLILTVIFFAIVILAFVMLRRHRKHVIHTLHETYADEAESKRRDRESNKKKINNEQNDEKSDKSNESGKSDDKIEYKFDVDVPDTYMWDTDDGDADITNQQEQGIFKQGLYEKYQAMNRINQMKKMSKMKKQEKKKSSKKVNEETPLLDNKDRKGKKKDNKEKIEKKKIEKKKNDKKKIDKKKIDKKKNDKKAKK